MVSKQICSHPRKVHFSQGPCGPNQWRARAKTKKTCTRTSVNMAGNRTILKQERAKAQVWVQQDARQAHRICAWAQLWYPQPLTKRVDGLSIWQARGGCWESRSGYGSNIPFYFWNEDNPPLKDKTNDFEDASLGWPNSTSNKIGTK